MGWEEPAADRPVWCSVAGEKSGMPTAQSVNCVTKDPAERVRLDGLTLPTATPVSYGDVGMASLNVASPVLEYKKFTSQDELGRFLVDHYKIRTPRELSSCEVCHR
jgi:hypothetical protein